MCQSKEPSSNIHFYSERGLVDALVLDLNDCMNNGNKEIVQNFFNAIDMYNGDKFPELSDKFTIDWFIEPNLGSYGFGSPDLIASITDNGKRYIIFFEAKLTSFIDNSKQPKCEEKKKIFDGQGSNLNIQLFYKYLFYKAMPKRNNTESNETEIYMTLKHEKSIPETRSYRLQKSELLGLYDDLFKDVDKNNIYYIALTNEEKGKLGKWNSDKSYFQYLEAGIISEPDRLITKDCIEKEFLTHLGCLNYNKFINDNLVKDDRINLNRLNAYKTAQPAYHFNPEWPDCLKPEKCFKKITPGRIRAANRPGQGGV